MVSETTPTSVPRLTVTVGKPEVVVPTVPREDHDYFLSNLDQNVAFIVKTVYLYHAKDGTGDPVQVIREALAKVLNDYYPLAGRLGISAEGKLQVTYKSQGVVFVEACADANLADLGNISTPDERLHKLLYTVPEATNILETPLVVAQVTKFNCGGFVLGLANQHSMFDGIAANEFVNAWGETARGLPITTPPVLDRSVLKARDPPEIHFPHLEFANIEDVSKNGQLDVPAELEHRSFCFSPAVVGDIKKKVMEEGGLPKCTTFEALSGLIWKAKCMSMKMEPEQMTRLYFAVDGRRKFVPPLPIGYMGNGIVLTCAMTNSADLCDSPLHHSVKLVQEAITLIDDKYMKSCVDYYEATRIRPSAPGSMGITSWAKLPFRSDFGWGVPWQCGPVTLPDPHMVLFLADGMDGKNTIVMLGLPSKAMEDFVKLLADLVAG